MNVGACRFLAINCVLNGHSLLKAFDGDVAQASKALGKDADVVQDLDTTLLSLNKKASILVDYSPLTRVLLNYLRVPDYTFFCMPNSEPIFMNDLVESDRNGELEIGVAQAVVMQLIHDVSYVRSEKDSKIVDGIVYMYGSQKDFQNSIIQAYALFRDGPISASGKHVSETLFEYRSRLTLDGYKDISASNCWKILNELATGGVKPTDYRDTFLVIPDFLPVYEASGCIMCPAGDDPDSVWWLLETEGTKRTKVMGVHLNMLRTLIVNGAKDLANIRYVPGAANGGLGVKS